MIEIIDRIVERSASASEASLIAFENKFGVRLPDFHREVLKVANGFSFCSGAFRWLGTIGTSGVNLVEWNDPSHWKFAWGGEVRGYLCFFETAFGEQYAYNIQELRNGSSKVYELDAITMKPELLEDNIEGFWESEIVRNVCDPYDSLLKQAIDLYQTIPIDKHVIYSPSILLTNDERIENTQLLNARSAMIINGDMYRELANENLERQVKEVVLYNDESGNARARIEWENNGE